MRSRYIPLLIIPTYTHIIYVHTLPQLANAQKLWVCLALCLDNNTSSHPLPRTSSYTYSYLPAAHLWYFAISIYALRFKMPIVEFSFYCAVHFYVEFSSPFLVKRLRICIVPAAGDLLCSLVKCVAHSHYLVALQILRKWHSPVRTQYSELISAFVLRREHEEGSHTLLAKL